MLNLYQAFYVAASKHKKEVCLADARRQITYEQALFKIDEIVTTLTRHDIKPNDVVAIYADKSIEAVLSYLAIVKCGGVALTLDLAFPMHQVLFTLVDADAKLILRDEASFDEAVDIPVIMISNHYEIPTKNVCEGLEEYVVNKSAWLVYSSGSTGKPKGMVISHETILTSYEWRYQEAGYQSSDVVACHIYLYWEVFRPLLKGAKVYILSDFELHDFNTLSDVIFQQKVTEILMTPSYAEMFWQFVKDEHLSSKLSTLSRCWLNGEVVSNLLKRLVIDDFSETQFYNLYSISETFDVAMSLLNKEASVDKNLSCVGRVFSEVTAVILDDNHHQLKTNEVGALYIGGKGLCEGYLNRPDLNESLFIEAQNSPTGMRLFKTGDKAFIDTEHRLTILGRIDSVVKLRGYNVSLLAIESLMKACLPIKQCVVKAQQDRGLEASVIAYIEAEDGEAFATQYGLNETGISRSLTVFLKAHMPHYMVPSRFILSQFNLNAYSAKLNRKEAGLTKPTSIEGQLKQIWCDVLGTESFHESDSFFELGGHSLALIQLLQRIKKTFSIALTIADLDTHPNFISQVKLIKQGGAKRLNLFLEEPINILEAPETENTTSLSKPKQFFLTGSTGFLGIHLLKELSIDANIIIHCLIRGKDENDARLRLQTVAKQYEINFSDDELSRIKVYSGSLDEKQLGLSGDIFHRLSHDIDIVLHAAATVNLLLPFERLKKVNVDSIYEILSLIKNGKKKSLGFISSDAVIPNIQKTFSEDFIARDDAMMIPDGYGQSKWVAEEVLRHHTWCEYAIFRLGNLGPARGSLIANPDDANNFLFNEVRLSQTLPKELSIEITPVDIVTKAIVSEFYRHNFNQKIYHMSQSKKISSEEIKQFLDDVKIIPKDDWIHHIQNQSLSALIAHTKFCFEHKYHLAFDNALDAYQNIDYSKSSYIQDLTYLKSERCYDYQG